MAKPTGFLEYRREGVKYRSVSARLRDWKHVQDDFAEEEIRTQAARCMDCGIPFCHNGCPLGNVIPDWNDLVYRGRWEEAIEALHATNNFPEFTGRICPAPCEESCVLRINDDPVTIKLIERNIIDHAWSAGYVKPQPPEKIRTQPADPFGPIPLRAPKNRSSIPSWLKSPAAPTVQPARSLV